MPLGDVVADLADRRRLLTTWQLVGAVTTAAVAALVLTGRIAVWHIYAFTLGFSLGMLWAGVAIDRFGLTALAGGAALLGLVSMVVALIEKCSTLAPWRRVSRYCAKGSLIKTIYMIVT